MVHRLQGGAGVPWQVVHRLRGGAGVMWQLLDRLQGGLAGENWRGERETLGLMLAVRVDLGAGLILVGC